MSNPTGYGPSTSKLNHFDGDEKNYEMFEMKFMGHLHRLKLKAELKKEPMDAGKNEDIFAELIQVLDDRSLALIMRDALDDGKKALEILREHYMSQSKPKVLCLYTELATLEKKYDEDITGYVIRAEKAIAALRNCGKNWNDLLKRELLKNGFKQSNVDPCMFLKDYGNKVIIILVWVDDILIAASDLNSLMEVKTQFMQKFRMTDLGPISKFLGIEFKVEPGHNNEPKGLYRKITWTVRNVGL